MKDKTCVRPSAALYHLASVLLVAAVVLAGCAATPSTTQPTAVPEIRPGVAAGYLKTEQMPDSVVLLPPPPARDSADFAADLALSKLQSLRGTPRWDQAVVDDNLAFPASAEIFSCAMNMPISEALAPRLYALLRRTRTDAAVASDGAKHHYKRPRPFMENRQPSCTPAKEQGLAENGSYPSGHTSIGWAWALILAELAPTRIDAVLARGRSYGESRLVCNVHWQSDVVQGRFMGASVVARLHADPTFRADLEAARAEVATLASRRLKPSRDCAAEASALRTGLPSIQ
ncbi:MAG: phosphatase PAP2 family protein [Rhodanobacter sp.]